MNPKFEFASQNAEVTVAAIVVGDTKIETAKADGIYRVKLDFEHKLGADDALMYTVFTVKDEDAAEVWSQKIKIAAQVALTKASPSELCVLVPMRSGHTLYVKKDAADNTVSSSATACLLPVTA
jgi:hypothetical protein